MNITVKHLSKSFGASGSSGLLRVFGRRNDRGVDLGAARLRCPLMGLWARYGYDRGAPPKKRRFQEDRLCETFTAVANVRMTCPTGVSRETIVRHLTEIGLDDSLSLPVSELSGGMRRRVAIVRAVLAGGDVLFFDEPFKGLDAELKRHVIRYVTENTKGKTVIVVTHDEDEARELGGRLIDMDAAGEIRAVA